MSFALILTGGCTLLILFGMGLGWYLRGGQVKALREMLAALGITRDGKVVQEPDENKGASDAG